MDIFLSNEQLTQKVEQLATLLKTVYPAFDDVVFVGIQQGGVALADELVVALQKNNNNNPVQYGQLDITFYRDDLRKEILAPDTMHIPFAIENKTVVLIDDVLFTGRTIKAALDALLDYGRPAKVELLVLVDRREHRQFPIQADYTGMQITTAKTDKVKLLKDDAGKKYVALVKA